MHTIDSFPDIGFEHLGPQVDDATAQLRAWQLSQFMRNEVHGPVYEDTFHLRYIDPDPPSGTPGDIPWRIEGMRQNNTVQPNGKYREYLIAGELDASGKIAEAPLALVGLLVVTKPQGICTENGHTPTEIFEIDVARRMYGKNLAPNMLALAEQLHPQDPRISLSVYEKNRRAIRFYEKLGFVLDSAVPPEDGVVYQGKWVTYATTGPAFAERLSAMLAT